MRFHRFVGRTDRAIPARLLIACVAIVLVIGSGADSLAQSDGAAAKSRATTPQEDAEILQAVIDYANVGADSRARAMTVFARYPENVTSLYYRGLHEMQRGIEARSEAGAPGDPQYSQKSAEAQSAFGECRKHLKALMNVGQVDRTIQPVEAGIILATADLAEPTQTAGGFTEDSKRLTGEAIEILNKYLSLQENRDDYLAHFYLGVAYFRMSRIAEKSGDAAGDAANRENSNREFGNAVARVGQFPPESEERLYVEAFAKWYGALAHVRVRNYPEAISTLQSLQRFAESNPKLRLADLQAQAEELVSSAKQIRESPNLKLGPLDLRGYVTIGNAYDSNVAIPGERAELPRGIVKKGDYVFSLSGGAQLSYRFSKDRDQFALGESLELGIRGDTSHAWHPSINEFDLNSYRAGVFATWEPWKDVFAYADYTYTDTELGREPFFGDHGAVLGVRKVWSDIESNSDGTALNLYYAYDNRTYYDVLTTHYLDRDGNYHEVGLRQSFDLIRADKLWDGYYAGKAGAESEFDAKRWLNVYLGYDYRNERTQGSEFDLYSHEATAGVYVPLPWRLAFDYGVRLSWDNYASPSLFDLRGNERFDFRHTHDLGLTYTIVERGELKTTGLETVRMRLRGFVGFVDQDSNVANSLRQAPYSYDRILSGVVLEIGF